MCNRARSEAAPPVSVAPSGNRESRGLVGAGGRAMSHDELNDRRVSYYESRKGGVVARIVRWLTRWAWKRHVRAPIDRMFERGLINSRVYHEAHDYATRIIYSTPAPGGEGAERKSQGHARHETKAPPPND